MNTAFYSAVSGTSTGLISAMLNLSATFSIAAGLATVGFSYLQDYRNKPEAPDIIK